MEQDLSFLDLVFCVDLTNSMTPFIHQARQHMVNILKSLAVRKQAELRVGLAGYHDYPTPVKVHPLTHDLKEMQTVLQGLTVFSPPENQDAAEAVFAGLLETVSFEWRPRAYRILVLVGDAPPHGCGASQEPYPDRFPQEDPTGLSLLSMAGRIEEANITLYSLAMLPSSIPVHDPITERTFEKLALSTGGSYRRVRSARDAMACVEDIGKKVFGELELDRQMWEQMQKAPAAPMATVAMEMGLSLDEAARSQARLKKRGYQQSE